MASISAGAAIGAGFRAIARNPLALLFWAGVYLLLHSLPTLLLAGSMMGDMGDFYERAARHAWEGGRPDFSWVAGMTGKMMLWRPILFLGSLVSQTLILGAIYRAVLTPQDRRFGYLRIGRAELWLGLTLLVFWVVIFLLVLVLALPLIAGGVITALQASRNVASAGITGIVVGLAAIGFVIGLLWVMIRLSLGPVMSWASGDFKLFDSWQLTRGHEWSIFLICVGLVVILWLCEVILGGIAAAVFLGSGGLDSLRNITTPMQAWDRVGPFLPVMVVCVALFQAFALAVFAAPFAEIYRELMGGASEANPAVA
jgi:hypothetical protein